MPQNVLPRHEVGRLAVLQLARPDTVERPSSPRDNHDPAAGVGSAQALRLASYSSIVGPRPEVQFPFRVLFAVHVAEEEEIFG